MAYKEKDFISKILRPYLKQSNFPTSYIEAKVSAGNTVPFSGFQAHQLATLEKVRTGQDIYKISDTALGGKPADVIVANKIEGWVAILFEKEKTPRKIFHIISIREVFVLKEQNKKSITKDDCEEKGLICYLN